MHIPLKPKSRQKFLWHLCTLLLLNSTYFTIVLFPLLIPSFWFLSPCFYSGLINVIYMYFVSSHTLLFHKCWECHIHSSKYNSKQSYMYIKQYMLKETTSVFCWIIIYPFCFFWRVVGDKNFLFFKVILHGIPFNVLGTKYFFYGRQFSVYCRFILSDCVVF